MLDKYIPILSPGVTLYYDEGAGILTLCMGELELRISDSEGQLYSILSNDLLLKEALNDGHIATEKGARTAQILKALQSSGYIENNHSSGLDAYERHLKFMSEVASDHYASFGLKVGGEAAKLFDVVIEGDTGYETHLRVTLESIGIDCVSGFASDPDRPGLRIYLCNAGIDTEKDLEANAKFVRDGERTLYIIIDVPKFTVGPLYIPGASGCLACFLKRKEANKKSIKSFSKEFRRKSPYQLRPSSIVGNIMSGLVANISLKLAYGLTHLVPAGYVAEVDLLTDGVNEGRSLRIPLCTTCGPSGRRQPAITNFRVSASVDAYAGDGNPIE